MRLTRFALPLIAVVTLNADEGLWPYNQFPQDALKTKNGFDTPPGFLDHLRLSSVRIGAGSGAFVSVDGLILTSRQGAAGCSVPVDGFVSATRAAELRCPTLDAGVLLNIEDVSAQLKTTGQSLTQRNAAVTKIERDCAAKTGNVCSVVRLFAGGRYDLYRYKRYADVRLVFAPEYSAAFFGKERDSITYLRYGLNVAFLRAYENGQPAHTPDFLKWSPDGVKEGLIRFNQKGGRETTKPLHPNLIPLFEDLQARGTTETYPHLNWGNKWFRFLKRAGIKDQNPNACFHSLRVTVASRLARHNVPMRKAMEYLTHASSTVHAAYVRWRPEDVAECHKAV